MAGLLIILGIAAAVVCYGTVLFVPAVVVAVVAFWSNGVLANFRRDPQSAPDAAALVSMLSAAASVVLVIVGFILR